MHPGSFLTLMVYCKLNKESSSEKFVNRLSFDRIMDTSLCLTFFWSTVYVSDCCMLCDHRCEDDRGDLL